MKKLADYLAEYQSRTLVQVTLDDGKTIDNHVVEHDGLYYDDDDFNQAQDRLTDNFWHDNRINQE